MAEVKTTDLQSWGRWFDSWSSGYQVSYLD